MLEEEENVNAIRKLTEEFDEVLLVFCQNRVSIKMLVDVYLTKELLRRFSTCLFLYLFIF